jgi:hypothetical protein
MHVMNDPSNSRQLARICAGNQVRVEFEEASPWDIIADAFNAGAPRV